MDSSPFSEQVRQQIKVSRAAVKDRTSTSQSLFLSVLRQPTPSQLQLIKEYYCTTHHLLAQSVVKVLYRMNLRTRRSCMVEELYEIPAWAEACKLVLLVQPSS